jgi:phosphatidylinositol-3-phosphatase
LFWRWVPHSVVGGVPQLKPLNLESYMKRMFGRRLGVPVALVIVIATVVAALGTSGAGAKTTKTKATTTILRAALPVGAIQHVFVIELENASENVTYGPQSAATYLNDTLLKQGVFIPNFYGSGHASLDNYIASVSGQAPNDSTSADCAVEVGANGSPVNSTAFDNVEPGTLANQKKYPGQVNATSGCVYPSSVNTIANQLDSKYGVSSSTGLAPWRDYEQDMGNDPARDGGVTDPLGGTDCAHPAIGANNNTNSAEAASASSTGVADQFAVRHDPFQWFHSIINDSKLCDDNVVPLGGVTVGTPSTFDGTKLANTFSGQLYNNLKSASTTPKFGWITPNLCNDGHDYPCKGDNTDGQTGSAASDQQTNVDQFLQAWVPLLEASPAYKQGHMMIVITTDEAETPAGGDAQDAGQIPGVPAGPSDATPGNDPLEATLYASAGLPVPTVSPANAPGGGKIGTVIIAPKYIKGGTVDNKGEYDQYSALRSYEDLLGITTGGTDGEGHLGYAGLTGLKPFGSDVFNKYKAPKATTTKSKKK